MQTHARCDTLRCGGRLSGIFASELIKEQERTEGDELEQAIQRVLRDVRIAENVDLVLSQRDGHIVPTILF